MKNIVITLLTFSALFLAFIPAPAQISSKPINTPDKFSKIDNEFNLLLYYKVEYERYDEDAHRSSSLKSKRDSFYKLYIEKTNEIRRNPGIYLAYINKALKHNRHSYQGPIQAVRYDYFDTSKPYDRDIHFVERLELYRLIKEHIFNKNAVLPQRLDAYKNAGGSEAKAYKKIDNIRK